MQGLRERRVEEAPTAAGQGLGPPQTDWPLSASGLKTWVSFLMKSTQPII